MAKRTRYPGRTSGRRPGANRLVRRDAPRAKPVVTEPVVAEPVTPAEILDPVDTDSETGAPATARGVGLSEAEIERAAQLEAEVTERERAIVAATRKRAEEVPARPHGHEDVNAPLALRASREYAYVARDVRRIILTGGLMVAILAAIDVLVNVLGVVKL
jgi:hypothetical protein